MLYTVNHIKTSPSSHNGEHVNFTYEESKQSLVFFRNMASYIIKVKQVKINS